MIDTSARPPTFWRTVAILVGSARRRSLGRRRRQQQILNTRAGRSGTNWGVLGILFGVLFMVVIHGLAAFAVHIAARSPGYPEKVASDRIVVSRTFLLEAETAYQGDDPRSTQRRERFYDAICSTEARDIATRTGRDEAEVKRELLDSLHRYGTTHLVPSEPSAKTPRLVPQLQPGNRFAPMLGSIVLGIWLVMLIFQGEGLDLDLQRRRHPMWEWLFSHPVPQGAVFLAEMLSPIAASPLYWAAPAFVGILYGLTYSVEMGILATVAIGLPVTLALACLGKALENAVILRLAPRTRGAVVGVMGWLGYASMMFFLLGGYMMPQLGKASRALLHPFAVLPWPWLRWFLGGSTDGTFSFVSGLLFCWAVAVLTITASVWFSVWATEQGLSGNFSAAESRVPRAAGKGPGFGREPLYRKEFLWFKRDRSAIVQTILIPVTLAATQAFNLRGILGHAQGAWNYLCGVAILFGTYFLWVLGPKSLASEGSALWIALTWPRGLEALLKAKAWLWSLISSGIVALVLCYAALMFPHEGWKIALVGVGWFIFARSMAEKAVTLVTITSDSGETQKIPWGRRGATQLGMLTFALGVLNQQWHIAIIGIVYSYITAAAIWQNFRAHLPFLYDPWSEELPPPPTLMHAMVSISLLVEGGAIVTGILVAFSGRENIGVAQGIGYAVCSAVVAFGASHFLENRGVEPGEVWIWPVPPPLPGELASKWRSFSRWIPAMLVGIAGGLILGLFAHGYMLAVQHIPAAAELIRKSQEQMAKLPGLRISYAIAAILFAPFAEEYLFRGLLFRALDREWGGWRAVVGSAAFFAIYHPPLAWIPVGLLGATNALLFKRTGKLAPAVALHMVYNAVVTLTS